MPSHLSMGKDDLINGGDDDGSDVDDGGGSGGDSAEDDNDAIRADPSDRLPVKPPPTMDVTVHRLRHLNFHPKPILCLASATAACVDGGGLVALSRDNGSVELKQVRKFRTVATVAGFRQKPVNAMAWLPPQPAEHDLQVGEAKSSVASLPPLVGASRDGTLFCVDFVRRSLTGITPSGGGGVFALTTKNRRRDPLSALSAEGRPLFAAGCEDGVVRIWKYDGSDGIARSDRAVRLNVVSTLPAVGAPILSMAWCTEDRTRGGKMYAAVADGTIRVFDESLDAPLRWSATLRMTVESLGRTIPTRVWALEILRDGTLVSADSLGHVQFWDGHTGTLQQSIDQSDSRADVLCLAVADDETTIFASGVDSRVVCMERVPASGQVRTDDGFGPILQWNISHAQRPHTHDVNALTIVRQSSRGSVAQVDKRGPDFQDILCSGGVDTKLCTYHVRDGRKKRPKTLYPWPATLISIARTLRIFIMMREDAIDLYQLGPKQSFDETFPIQIPPDKTLIGTVRVESVSNLVCATISDDGRYLAVSDASSVSVFLLTFTKDGSSVATMLQPQRIAIDEAPAFAASAMCFHGSGNALVCACLDGKLRFLEIEEGLDVKPIAHLKQVLNFTGVDDGASRAAAESVFMTRDGTFLATTYSVPACGIEIYRASTEASFSHWWTVPTSDMNPTASSFLLTDQPLLAVACLNFSTYVFDVHKRRLSPWSDAAGYPLRNLPPELWQRNDYPVHIAVNPAASHKFLVASFGAFVVFDLLKDFPTRCRVSPEMHVRGKKHKRPRLVDKGSENDGEECTLCLRYNSMLSLDAVSENELFVVEQPWLSVVATFPEALQRKVYGT